MSFLNLCSHIQTMTNGDEKLTDERRKQVLAANDAMTGSALRVLGVAYSDDPFSRMRSTAKSWKRTSPSLV